MESPPRLGLEIIYIYSTLVERPIFTKARVRSLGIRWEVLGIQPH